MEKSEFDRIAYAELAELFAGRQQGTIPKPQPLDISPWIAMSVLQKSIRRGEIGHALNAAATLLRDDPQRLWRRLVIAVFEDVGLGQLNLIAPVLIATGSKNVRRQFGGEWPVASLLVERMAEARKCRAADDIFMSLAVHPRYDAVRLSYSFLPLPELMAIATGDGEIVSKAIALVFALGTNRCPIPTMRIRQGSPAFVFQFMRDVGFPHCVLDLAERGSTRFREPLPALMAFLSQAFPQRSSGFEPTEKDDDFTACGMIGDVPGWAVDYYTRPGREALRQFLIRDTRTAQWTRKHIPPARRVEVLGSLVFRAEGGLLKRRLQWPQGDDLRRIMETEAVGFGVTNATEPLELLRDDLPALHEERRNVF
jgi:hypothetical protein